MSIYNVSILIKTTADAQLTPPANPRPSSLIALPYMWSLYYDVISAGKQVTICT
jgi:hypothetical protein